MSAGGEAKPVEPGPASIVLDTGPTIALDRLGYLDVLLGQRDIRLVLPRPVAEELEAKPEAPGAGVAPRLSICDLPRADLESVRRPGAGPALGAGELAVVLVAERLRKEHPQSSVLAIIDDRDAWRFAAHRWGGSEELTGTLGVLYFIHERGLQRRDLQADVGKLRASGHHLSEAEVEHFLSSTRKALRAVRDVPAPAGELWLKRMRTAGLQRSTSRRGRPGQSGHSVGEGRRRP